MKAKNKSFHNLAKAIIYKKLQARKHLVIARDMIKNQLKMSWKELWED